METNRHSYLATLAVVFLGILWSHIMSVETTERVHIQRYVYPRTCSYWEINWTVEEAFSYPVSSHIRLKLDSIPTAVMSTVIFHNVAKVLQGGIHNLQP